MKYKKILGLVCAAIMLLGNAGMVQAATNSFNIRVTDNGANQDNISRRTVKDNGTYIWYVNPSSFSQSGGKIDLCSRQLNNTAVKSPFYLVSDMDIGENLPLQYGRSVPNNVDYYMEGRFNVNCPGRELTVTGHYTP